MKERLKQTKVCWRLEYGDHYFEWLKNYDWEFGCVQKYVQILISYNFD